eukprot:Nitzschia sp. Nitz4//scaffold49_size126201//93516//96257//NITZ4_003655-RA/size126201-processed-gene-0.76-mRNA-1//1//CDS//3329553188//1470//frame0
MISTDEGGTASRDFEGTTSWQDPSPDILLAQLPPDATGNLAPNRRRNGQELRPPSTKFAPQEEKKGIILPYDLELGPPDDVSDITMEGNPLDEEEDRMLSTMPIRSRPAPDQSDNDMAPPRVLSKPQTKSARSGDHPTTNHVLRSSDSGFGMGSRTQHERPKAPLHTSSSTSLPMTTAFHREPTSAQLAQMIPRLSTTGTLEASSFVVTDIPVILHCLGLPEANSRIKRNALQSLVGLTSAASTSRRIFFQAKGWERLLQTIWADMAYVVVLLPILDLLLILLIEPKELVVSTQDGEALVDALLCSMDTHSNNPSLLKKVFPILSCLAHYDPSLLPDGTLSGADSMVLLAMERHVQSDTLQLLGLQTLYQQCSHSSHAEQIKKSVVDKCAVVLHAMDALQHDEAAMVWGCRLLWLLTSRQDLLSCIHTDTSVAQSLISLTRRLALRYTASTHPMVVEPLLGIWGNWVHVEQDPEWIKKHHVLVRFTIQGLTQATTTTSNDEYRAVGWEAVMALANWVVFPTVPQALEKEKSLDIALSSVITFTKRYTGESELVLATLRFLVGLLSQSESARNALASSTVMSFLLEVVTRLPQAQELVVLIFAAWAMEVEHVEFLQEQGGLEWMDQLWQDLSEDESLAEAVFQCYRNIATHNKQEFVPLMQSLIPRVLDIMHQHSYLLSIQVNGSAILWFEMAHTHTLQTQHGTEIITVLVEAMQNHTISPELLEFSCGTLWYLANRSPGLQEYALSLGTMDVVYCALVMHPTKKPTLHSAFGILSVYTGGNLDEPLIDALNNSQWVHAIIELLHNHKTDLALLQLGCLVLRNIVLQLPVYVYEATDVVGTVLRAMRLYKREAGFLGDASCLLLVLASKEESCKSRIVALEGIEVLMECLEHIREGDQAQQSILGTLNVLMAHG